MRSFQDSQDSLSAVRIRASPLARASADCAARMFVIALARPSSLCSALRSPPESGVGWCFGATCRRLPERGPTAVLFVTSCALLASGVEQSLSDLFPDRVETVEPGGIGLLDFDD